MSEWVILAIAGGVFIVLGILSVLWGRKEQKEMDEALTISIGILMVIIGLILWGVL